MKPVLENDLIFPVTFEFGGASVAEYQVNGGKTQWAAHEVSEKRKAELAASGKLAQHELDDFVCGSACKFDEYFREDMEMAAHELGMNALRFGAEPAKVMPAKNVFDDDYLALCLEKVRFAKSVGIKPFFNIWHWTIPVWWEDEGGMAAPNAPIYFAQYTEKLVEVLGDEVEYWITLNETNVFILLSYVLGQWPPQLKDEATAAIVFENLVECHQRAYEIIKRHNPNAKVGIAQNLGWNEVVEDTPENWIEKEKRDQDWNWSFLDRINMDFIGMNHYGRTRIGGSSDFKPEIISDFGWELYPEAIYHIIMETYARYKLPIIITENGLADEADTRRGWFIFETMKWIHKAIEDGAHVFGYLHWSLLRNFEWAEGWTKDFGLIYVDLKNNLKRTIRPSARFFGAICRARAITKEIVSKYRGVITLPKKEVDDE
jgi:beta-glucosidase